MTPEQELRQLRFELRLYGFAAAKRISELLKQPAGEMECPLCQKRLRYSTAPNGHFAAKCETPKCINAME